MRLYYNPQHVNTFGKATRGIWMIRLVSILIEQTNPIVSYIKEKQGLHKNSAAPAYLSSNSRPLRSLS